MGLAAGQARLLTITGRKSDCEFQSMRLSHQKIALARDLAALSNEYQNSLNQTKLIYDFYGTGDTSMNVTYATFMTPSALNNYKPILVTDSMNRVVLNAQYAAAAEAAGIPREGLGSLPSETMRNNFIAALANKYITYENKMVLDNFTGKYKEMQVAVLKEFDPPRVSPQIISDYLCTHIIGDIENGILGVPYNQDAGFGSTLNESSVVTKEMTLDEICDYIRAMGEGADVGNACSGDMSHIKRYIINTYQHDAVRYNANGSHYIDDVGDDAPGVNSVQNSWNCYIGGVGTGDNMQCGWTDTLSAANITGTLSNANKQQMTIGDMIVDFLENGTDYMLTIQGKDNDNNVTGRNGIVDFLCNCNLWNQMFDTFEQLFDNGSAGTQMALLAARETIEAMLYNPSADLGHYDTWDVGTDGASVSDATGSAIWIPASARSKGSSASDDSPDGMNDFDSLAAYAASQGGDWYDSQVVSNLCDMTGYVGMCVVENNDNYGSSDDDSDMSAGCINMSRIIMAYLTELYMNLNGTNAGDYRVQKGLYADNKFIDGSCVFTVVDTDVSSEVSSYAAFYDTIFNKICRNGWCENDYINDTEYLQNVLKNGMVYITKLAEDNYYYQGNYATDPYIKEVADETLIAKAEAKYNTEKAKLNAKEETIDLKMKNLDTEISALTTEYDTVKSTISKQIEKCFKRYNA